MCVRCARQALVVIIYNAQQLSITHFSTLHRHLEVSMLPFKYGLKSSMSTLTNRASMENSHHRHRHCCVFQQRDIYYGWREPIIVDVTLLDTNSTHSFFDLPSHAPLPFPSTLGGTNPPTYVSSTLHSGGVLAHLAIRHQTARHRLPPPPPPTLYDDR